MPDTRHSQLGRAERGQGRRVVDVPEVAEIELGLNAGARRVVRKITEEMTRRHKKPALRTTCPDPRTGHSRAWRWNRSV